MKIVGEYLLVDENGNFFKVVKLSSGAYFQHIERAGRYAPISNEIVEKSKERMKKF